MISPQYFGFDVLRGGLLSRRQAKVRALPCVSDTQVTIEGTKNVMKTQIHVANSGYRDVSVFWVAVSMRLSHRPRAFTIFARRTVVFFASRPRTCGIDRHKSRSETDAATDRTNNNALTRVKKALIPQIRVFVSNHN